MPKSISIWRPMVLLLAGCSTEARKLDSRAPDTLYQSLIRKSVQIGGEVSGVIVPNAWKNGPDQIECKEKSDDTTPALQIDHGWGYEPPVIVCDELEDNFSITVNVKLAWSNSKEAIQEENVQIFPNNPDNNANFKFNIPADIKSSKPEEWSSLTLQMMTKLANGSDFGIQETEYLTLIDRDQILIQTDKAKYKPGNKVQGRFIFTDINLKPVTMDTLKYTIYSPSNNKMQQKSISPNGFVNHFHFQLDKYAEQGEWRIEVEAGNQDGIKEESYSFDVEEYVLPKFEVNIGLDKNFMVLGEREDIPIKLDATYTFGQPVAGDAQFTVKKLACDNSGYYYGPEPMIPVCENFEKGCPEYDENGCEVPPELNVDIKKYSGSTTFTLSRAELEKIAKFEGRGDTWRCRCGNNLKLEASVTDKFSGEIISTEAKLNVETKRYKVSSIYSPTAPREGVPMEYIGKVEYIDGSGIDIPGTIECLFEHTCYNCDEVPPLSFTQTLDVEGGGYFKCAVPDEYRNLQNFNAKLTFTDTLNIKSLSSASTDLYYYKSYTQEKEFVTISSDILDRKLVPGEIVPFTVKTNYKSDGLSFVVIAKNEIKSLETVQGGKEVNTIINVEIDHSMIPEARFIVWENRGENWAADSLTYFVDENLENQIAITPSTDSTKVGEEISIEVSAEPNSEVFLLGVDKSVLLLATGNDITKKTLLEVMSKPSEGSWRPWDIWGGCGWWFPFSYGSDSESKLRDAGYGIMNVKSNEELIFMPNYYEDYAVAVGMPIEATADDSEGPGGSSSEAEIKTRKNFPETWIWDSVNVDENGKATMSDLVIPDTITSWIVSGFGVSETAGLGVAEKSSILAFQDFFIKLQLPYSIKQGEMFKLQATIYNYRSSNAKTFVTLNNDNRDFDIEMGVDQTVTIEANSAHTTTWVITPNKSGVIPINVRAVIENNIAGDQIERLLIVKPEGIPESQIQNGLLQDNDETVATVEFPTNTVDGSKRVEVRMFGNVLANTLENIDELLKMPSGCGEQNMYNFAPSAFIYEYLKKTGQLTDEIEEKAFKIMQTGYQRELTYRHSAGGYSAFGEKSYYGDEKKAASTVLTSFVAKCFQIANSLVEEDLIDDKVVADDLEWLAQTFDGKNFVENGRVFSSQLMGGLNKDGPIAITAYTTIVFAENYENLSSDHKSIVDKAADSMASALDTSAGKISDHTVSMICYILHLVDHSSKTDALNTILDRATEKAGYLQWIVENGWRGPQANVEIASYVLLSYAQLDPASMLADALPVFMGVQKEMTETGGFSSTQDTVLGLQAMTSYAALMTSDNTNIDISIIGETASGDETTMGTATITEDDAMIVRVQNIDLSDDITSVKLESSGSGTIYTQLVLHYYVDENVIEPFEVEFEYSNDVIKRRSTEDDSEKSKDICIKITAKSADEETGSGMTLVMIEHASGYTYKSHEEFGTVGKIKKYESDADKTTFYYDDLLEERELKFCMQYVEAIANPRPVFVSVQDYYNPSAKADTKVELTSRQGEDACDVCGCACSECFDKIPSCTALDDNSDDGETTTTTTESTTKTDTTTTTKPIKVPDIIYHHESKNGQATRDKDGFGFLPGPYDLNSEGVTREAMCLKNFGHGWRPLSAGDDIEMAAKILDKAKDYGQYAFPDGPINSNSVGIMVDFCLSADKTGQATITACSPGYSSVRIACYNPDLNADHFNTAKSGGMFYCDLGAIGLMEKVGKKYKETKYNLKKCVQKRANGEKPKNILNKAKGQYQLDCVNCEDKNNVQWSAVECEIGCKKDKKGNQLKSKFRCEPVYDSTGTQVIGARSVYEHLRFQEICGGGCSMDPVADYMGSTTANVPAKKCGDKDCHNVQNFLPLSKCNFDCDLAKNVSTKKKTNKIMNCACKTENNARSCKWKIGNSDMTKKTGGGKFIQIVFRPGTCAA